VDYEEEEERRKDFYLNGHDHVHDSDEEEEPVFVKNRRNLSSNSKNSLSHSRTVGSYLQHQRGKLLQENKLLRTNSASRFTNTNNYYSSSHEK
jgi:hypothetical protein